MNGNTLLFGGWRYNFYGDTWIWDGTNWTELDPASKPERRESHAMATDRAGRIILYGGYGGPVTSDTWAWS